MNECFTTYLRVISITDGVLMCVNASFVKMACRSGSGVSRHLRGPGVFRWWRGTSETKAAAAPHPGPRTWWWGLVAGQWSSDVSPPQLRCGRSQHVSQKRSKDKNTLYYSSNNDFYFPFSLACSKSPHTRAQPQSLPSNVKLRFMGLGRFSSSPSCFIHYSSSVSGPAMTVTDVGDLLKAFE